MTTTTSPAVAAIFGSTGAVGSHILSTLLSSSSSTTTLPTSHIHTVSRRLPKPTSTQLNAILETDTLKWSPLISSLSPRPTIHFNAVGTTRAAAGGIDQQWKIDHDLCISLAQAAKDSGCKTYIFISSAGTRRGLTGRVPYSKMKVGVEDAIHAMGFEQAIILRPGFILGNREKPKAEWAEKFVGEYLPAWLRDRIGADQVIIGRAAVAATRIAQDGKAPSKYWVLEQADVLKYGRNLWKE